MSRETRRAIKRAERRRTDGKPPRIMRLLPNPLAYALSAHQPLEETQRNHLQTQVHGAINTLTHGRATEADMAHLFSAANITLILVEQTMGKPACRPSVYAQAEALVKRAQSALLLVQERHGRTQCWSIAGQELLHINELAELHDQFLEAADQRTIELAVETAIRRARQGHVAYTAKALDPSHAD